MDPLGSLHFLSLDPEVHHLVAQHLKGRDLLIYRLVCKFFYKLSCSELYQPMMEDARQDVRLDKMFAHIDQQKDPLFRVIAFLGVLELPMTTPQKRREAYRRALDATSNDFPRATLKSIAFRLIQEGFSNKDELADLLFNKAEAIFNELIQEKTSAEIAFGFLALAAAHKKNKDISITLLNQAHSQLQNFNGLFDQYFAALVLGYEAHILWQLHESEKAETVANQAMETLNSLERVPIYLYRELRYLIQEIGCQDKIEQKITENNDMPRKKWLKEIDRDTEVEFAPCMYRQLSALIFNVKQNPLPIDRPLAAQARDQIREIVFKTASQHLNVWEDILPDSTRS